MSSTISPPPTQEYPFAQGVAVFDLSDPDRLGKIIGAGPQQSEVKFDDGAVRILPNQHLRAVKANDAQGAEIAVTGNSALALSDAAIAEQLEVIAHEIKNLERTAVLQIAKLAKKAHGLFLYRRDEGGFTGWMETRLGYSSSTAYRLLNLDREFGNGESFPKWETLSVSVLYLLAEPSTPEQARKEIAERVEAGETISVAAVTETIARRKAIASGDIGLAADSTAETETAAVEDVADSEADDGDDQGDEPQRDSSWLLPQAWELAAPKDQVEFIQSKPVAEFIQSRPVESLLALMSDDQRTKLEHRIDGQRAAAVKPEIDANVLKALRQALSLQQAAKHKGSAATGVAAALNGILNMLRDAGRDLNDVDVVIRKATKRAA